MPAPQININLLEHDTFSQSAMGKVLLWALSIGRYIVVFTELIVILSFLSRFKLDRDLTDLNENIEKQKAIVTSYGDLEPRFTRTQEQLTYIKDNLPSYPADEILKLIEKTIPADIKIDQLGLNPNSFRLSGLALSPEGFIQFVKALHQQPQIKNISLGSITTETGGITIEFELLANLLTD